MIVDNTNYWNTPVRSFSARVELYLGSALADAYTAYYGLKSFKIERVGDNTKFFGYGICQKMNLKLVDLNRNINITTDYSLKPFLNTGGTLITSAPEFYVEQVHRDENTNELSITAYDALYKATDHKVSEINVNSPYTLLDFARTCAEALGCSTIDISAATNKSAFNTLYEAQPNFDGAESLRTALNAIAEATQTIYFINHNNALVFKSLDRVGEPVLTISREDYITLQDKDSRRLSTLTYVTDLENNLTTSLDVSGSTQYIRNNPFWEVFEDSGKAVLLNEALNDVGGLTIAQFSCDWRGNFALEIGDKIKLITNGKEVITSYLLDDVITYNGTLTEVTQWSYTDNESETAAAPISLGEKLNYTTAKIDKVNQEITLQVNSVTEKVNSVDNKTNEIQSELSTFKQTSNEALITFQTTIEQNGVTRVEAENGFVFDDKGLAIYDIDSDIETIITNDGMEVSRGAEIVLTANNQGVKAEDLHATTYLIIGENSRLENYNGNRTGCFWIKR